MILLKTTTCFSLICSILTGNFISELSVVYIFRYLIENMDPLFNSFKFYYIGWLRSHHTPNLPCVPQYTVKLESGTSFGETKKWCVATPSVAHACRESVVL